MAYVRGDKETIKKLKQLPEKIEKKVCRKAVRAGAKVQQAAAQAETPVVTGELKRSEKVRAQKARKGKVGVKIETQVPYGPSVELGTEHQEGQHFLERAAEAKQEQALSVMKSTLATGIDAVAKGK